LRLRIIYDGESMLWAGVKSAIDVCGDSVSLVLDEYTEEVHAIRRVTRCGDAAGSRFRPPSASCPLRPHLAPPVPCFVTHSVLASSLLELLP